MTCLDVIDGSVGCGEPRLDVCPVFWMQSEVDETWNGVWLKRMALVEETVDPVAAEWELVHRGAQEVGSVLSSQAFLVVPS